MNIFRRFDYLQRMAKGGRGQAVELTWMMMFVLRMMIMMMMMMMMIILIKSLSLER